MIWSPVRVSSDVPIVRHASPSRQPTARGILRARGSVSLLRCPRPSAPALGAGQGKRRFDCFASSPETAASRSTIPRSSQAEGPTCIRDPSALSRRSSDVAWGGLYGRRSMDSEPLSRSGSSSACSLRHTHAAGHRVSNASAPTGADETSKHSRTREPNQKVGTRS